MKIIRFTAENVKKLTLVEIVPNGSVVQITGPNGSGKSSVLDAVYWALAGKRAIDAVPIREGADTARIRLDLGEIIVTRRFTAGGTSLTVEAADGAQYPSPQAMLDKILGALTFDPLAFARMEPRAQLGELRKLVPVAVDLDLIASTIHEAFEARTIVNREARETAAQVAAIPDEPVEPVVVNEIMADMEVAARRNSEIATEHNRRERERLAIAGLGEDLERVQRQIDALTQQRDQLQATIAARDAALTDAGPLPEPFDLAIYRARMDAAQEQNERAANWMRRKRLVGQLATLEGESAELTQRIQTLEAERAAAIEAAQMPIDGLAFGDGEVLYHGLPFTQASSGEQLRVSVAIAMATNPQLRVLRIKDGSLLDEKNLALIDEMAAQGDYQVWIERVETSGRVGIVMEDGHIAGAAGTAERTDA